MNIRTIILFCIAALLTAVFILANVSWAPALRDAGGKRIKKNDRQIAELLDININGSQQWISIRGTNRDAPVLLFLHGGPGSPEMTMTRKFFAGALEDSFVVVSWDQRGAGKSFRAGKGQTLTLNGIVEDARAVVEYLCDRFGQDKIFIVGHSWGTLVGTLLSSRYPEHIAAYCGVGQLVSGMENEKSSYAWTLEQARQRGDKKGIKALESISSYGENPAGSDYMKHIMVERKWLNRYGGESGHDPSFRGQLALTVIFAPEYTFMDTVNFLRGSMNSLKAMWMSVLESDLRELVPRLEVPVLIIAGRYDYNVPSPLAESYFQTLTAPRKRFVWFENSAHSPCFEEPQKFAEEVSSFFLVME